MGEFGRRKEKGKTLLIIITKINHENKQKKNWAKTPRKQNWMLTSQNPFRVKTNTVR